MLTPNPHEFFDLQPLLDVVVPFSINADDWAEMSDEEAVEAQGTIFDLDEDETRTKTMISATVIPEPDLEFGWAGRQLEQRRGLMLHGPADVGMSERKDELRLGIVGPTAYVDELAEWLKAACKGVERKQSRFEDLFPAFPGCSPSLGFLTALKLPAGGQRRLTKQRLRPIQDASSDVERIDRAVEICAEEVRNVHVRESVDVVMVIRPDGVPPGVPEGAATGADFHDLLKAELITTREPIQLIRTATWRGGKGVEDQATCAWNLFTALYYKAGGKPWRLVRSHSLPTRCYVGVSFTQSDAGDELLTSVAQVFNELGDGVIVRGGLAKRSDADRQPHLSDQDAGALLNAALARYKEEHRTLPAAVTLHKTSSFSAEEISGFLRARDESGLTECELLWISRSERSMLDPGNPVPPAIAGHAAHDQPGRARALHARHASRSTRRTPACTCHGPWGSGRR